MMRAKWACDMKRLSGLLMLALGLALMVWLLMQADWQALRDTLKSISPLGFATLLCIYPVAIWLDALTWQPYFRMIKKDWQWTLQLWKVQVVADAVQYITPLGAAGSEATKALILNRKHGIGYSDAAASLVSLQLLLAVAQLPFVFIGMAVMLQKNILPPQWRTGLILATSVITLFMLMLMLAVHKRWLRRLLDTFKPSRLRDGLTNVEEQLSTILSNPKRFCVTLAFAFANWACFAIEMWAIAYLLGHPISLADAWAIETLVSLARAATFFIPAHLGAQDGATSFAFKIFYSDPTLGLAVALLRRARELIWAIIALPLGFGDVRAATKRPLI
jgi:glycosyltransferase 2 family protein